MSPPTVYKKEKCVNLSLSLTHNVLGFYADAVTVLELNNSEG